MNRTIRLLLSILEALSTAMFLWPSAIPGLNRSVWGSMPDEDRDASLLFDQSGSVSIERDFE